MKAFRNVGGTVREIQVDVGLNGQPILPPDTTVDPRPDPLPGHYVTVVGNAWVQIEVPVYVESFDSKKAKALDRVRQYRDWKLEQPVDVNGVLFDGDDKARTRLTQALVMFKELNYLPPVWVDYNDASVTISSIDDLKTIVAAVTAEFSARFYETDTLRAQVAATTTEEELNAIVIPEVPMPF